MCLEQRNIEAYIPWFEVLHDAFAWRIDRALLGLVALAAATRCECVVQEAVKVVEGFVEEDRHFDVDLLGGFVVFL